MLIARSFIGLKQLNETFTCLKMTPFNMSEKNATEIGKKIHDAEPTFEAAYFKKIDFSNDMVAVFGLSKFQEAMVSGHTIQHRTIWPTLSMNLAIDCLVQISHPLFCFV